MKRMIRCLESIDDDTNSIYSIVNTNGVWSVVTTIDNEIVVDDLGSREEAEQWIHDHTYVDDDASEQYYIKRHEAELASFERYADRLPGKIFVEGHIGSRSRDKLKKFVDRFNESNIADISIEVRYDSEGPIYIAV